MEKAWIYDIVFQSGNRHGKKQKYMLYKRYNVYQNYFYELQKLHYMKKSKATSSFQGI